RGFNTIRYQPQPSGESQGKCVPSRWWDQFGLLLNGDFEKVGFRRCQCLQPDVDGSSIAQRCRVMCCVSDSPLDSAFFHHCSDECGEAIGAQNTHSATPGVWTEVEFVFPRCGEEITRCALR